MSDDVRPMYGRFIEHAHKDITVTKGSGRRRRRCSVGRVNSLTGNAIGYSAILLSPSRPPALLLPPVENLFYGTG